MTIISTAPSIIDWKNDQDMGIITPILVVIDGEDAPVWYYHQTVIDADQHVMT